MGRGEESVRHVSSGSTLARGARVGQEGRWLERSDGMDKE